MAKIYPVGDRVLVKTLNQEEKTKSGIIVATEENKPKAQGVIMEVGNGQAIKDLKLKVGDVVIYGKYAGEDVEIDDNFGKKIMHKMLFVGPIADSCDILAVVEE